MFRCKHLSAILFILGLSLVLLLAACKGGAGPQGPAGSAGQAGPRGLQGLAATGFNTGMDVTVEVSKPGNGTHLVAGEPRAEK